MSGPRSRTVLALGLLAVAAVALGAAAILFRSPPAAPAPAASALSPRQSVAVLGFRNATGREEAAWLATALAEMLTLELGAGERLRTIPGEIVARVRTDIGIEEGAPPPTRVLPRLRQSLGSDLVVFGHHDAAAAAPLTLTAAVMDTASGRVVAEAAETGDPAALLDLVSRVGSSIRKGLRLAEASGAPLALMPRGADASRLYAEGLARLRLFDAQAARGSLERAVQAEPSSSLAHSALAATWSQLGYDGRARAEARQAYELAADLPLAERLPIEARYRETMREWDRAIEIYRTLWTEWPDNPEYGLGVAAAQASAGKGHEALATVDRLRGMALAASADPRISLEEAKAAVAVGDLARALSAAQRAAAQAEERGARLLVAQARLTESDAHRRIGDLPRAVEVGEEARRHFAAAGDRGGEARALGHIASARWYQGDYERARVAADESLAVSREIGDTGGVARALNTIAGLLSEQGRLGDARKMYEETLALNTELGDRDREAVAINNIGIVLWKQGDLARARRAFEESAAVARALGSKRRESFAVFHMGEVLHDEGELEGARATYEKALALGRETGLPSFLGDAVRGLGKVLLAQGDLAAARLKLEEGLAIKRDRGEIGFAAQSLLALGQLALEEGRVADAERAVREAASEFKKDRTAHFEGLAHALLADVLVASSRAREAGPEVEAARALAARSEYTTVRLGVALAAARVDAASGRRAEGLRAADAVAFEARRAGLGLLAGEAALTGALLGPAGPARRARLEGFAQEAEAKGHGLLARKARAAAAAASLQATGH